MNTYKCSIKLIETKTIITNVEIQAKDAEKAKLQLETLYGKSNLLNYPALINKEHLV